MSQNTDNIAHALAGAGGGILSMTLTYPLITLSTRAQVESRRISQSTTSLSASTSDSTLESKRKKTTSALAAARHILRREGVSGLYSGLDSALFGISVTNFVYYYWYEWTRAFFERAALKAGRVRKGLTAVESMLAGAIAGSATVLITNPIWVVNTRMTARQSEKGGEGDVEGGEGKRVRERKPSTLATLLALFREEGPSALFAGVLPALVLVVNPILQYTIFEQLRQALAKRREVKAWDVFLLGALGKLAATSITYPYITVKSRMHVAKKGDVGEGKEGMTDSFRRVVREGGWGGLYKGMFSGTPVSVESVLLIVWPGIGPKVSQSVITAAFLFSFKDALYEASLRARKSIPAKVPVK
ncbi:uncharacterized protein KY384_000286 [Bacidia gigantensis]|uniref:uncharacterized protein n=1 Tax=Bacidia gigantensis TaxID=2732470 RepID=UPI001D054749|nr:uncharacterized protein KY384_000286 [Bacidia gigantensis]KAG8526293.1 hypothetical protein KY384_000286 [Bacidia gigantensis]